LVVIFGLFLLFLLLDWLFPLDIDRLNKPKSRVVYDKNGFIAYISLSSDGFVRVPLEGKIPQNIIDALLSYEDRYFYYHFGVNPLSLFRALIFDITHSRKIGASTITMQVARMMHHRPRVISSKIIEMFEALQLEWRYSKSDILRFYLNNAPYGEILKGLALHLCYILISL
jgi:penicillin-binding protein 1C